MSSNTEIKINAENVANKFKISRQEQDEFALNSQKKAEAALNLNKFDDELIKINHNGNVLDRDEHPRLGLKMFDLQKVIVLAKMKLINNLNKLSNVNTFLKTKRGYRVTGQEGYVAIDKLGGDAVKIVDRMEFSYANFSPNILKGWDKPGRN